MKTQPRQNWEAAFQEMHANGDDQLIIADVFEDEEFEEFVASNDSQPAKNVSERRCV